MTDAEFSDQKAREEAKRDRVQARTMTWQQIADVLSWAEAQLPPERRRNRPRTHRANHLS
jgi:hypothetical protein